MPRIRHALLFFKLPQHNGLGAERTEDKKRD